MINGDSYLSQEYYPNMNIIEQLEFDLNYFETTVQHFSYYITGTPTEYFGRFCLSVHWRQPKVLTGCY